MIFYGSNTWEYTKLGHINLSEEELKKLEDAMAFKNISNMPARVKCALLAWHTMEDLLDKVEK